jgi:solute carrier family 45 protein 1/2/4
LAFTEPIAKALVDLLGGGQGDWDPKAVKQVSEPIGMILTRQLRNTSIGIAVFSFYCLDFALNA